MLLPLLVSTQTATSLIMVHLHMVVARAVAFALMAVIRVVVAEETMVTIFLIQTTLVQTLTVQVSPLEENHTPFGARFIEGPTMRIIVLAL